MIERMIRDDHPGDIGYLALPPSLLTEDHAPPMESAPTEVTRTRGLLSVSPAWSGLIEVEADSR